MPCQPSAPRTQVSSTGRLLEPYRHGRLDVLFQKQQPGMRVRRPQRIGGFLVIALIAGVVTTAVLIKPGAHQPSVITTVAGTDAGGFSGDGGPATQAQLRLPAGMAVDAAGNLFIADAANNAIRRVDTTQQRIATVVGTGIRGFSGDGGPATEAQLASPYGIAVDTAGNLYIADLDNNRLRRVDTQGRITTVVGPIIQGQLMRPGGVAVDGAKNLYISSSENHKVYRLDSQQRITTIMGTGADGFSGDGGPATQAQLKSPVGMAVDAAGNLYIADNADNRIRRVDTQGRITTIAGTGEEGFSGDGGPATVAKLSSPYGVAVDTSGNLYIADTHNSRVRRVDTERQITTIAGTDKAGFSGDGGPATRAQLWYPECLTVDTAGNLYIGEEYRVRRLVAA